MNKENGIYTSKYYISNSNLYKSSKPESIGKSELILIAVPKNFLYGLLYCVNFSSLLFQ